ncbi:hypothetical protein TCSYLVIO_003579, partial [Trypanosoma cruzi]
MVSFLTFVACRRTGTPAVLRMFKNDKRMCSAVGIIRIFFFFCTSAFLFSFPFFKIYARAVMNAWFHATQAKCEVVFEMKLALYEEACAFLESSCHHDASDDGGGDIGGGGAEAAELLLQLLVMEKMRLEGP